VYAFRTITVIIQVIYLCSSGDGELFGAVVIVCVVVIGVIVVVMIMLPGVDFLTRNPAVRFFFGGADQYAIYIAYRVHRVG